VIRLASTVDVRGVIQVIDGRAHHLDYERSLEMPCMHLAQIADRYGLRITFLMPLSELIDDHPQVVSLLSSLAERHDCQALVHLPVPIMSNKAIVQRLNEEAYLHKKYLGRLPKAIRAGGHNVGHGRKWIDSVMEADYIIDSSVWPGASTTASRDILSMVVPTEESRWGTGAFQFDFRGAPLTGSYFADEDMISRPGGSSLLEVPITVREHTERRPFLDRFDFQYQDVASLRSIISQFLDEEALRTELLVNLATQSSGNMYSLQWLRWQHCDPNYRLKRFDNFAKWLNRVYLGTNVTSITLGDINPHTFCPAVRWSREQAEYYGAQTIRGKAAIGDSDCQKDLTSVTHGEATVTQHRQSWDLACERTTPDYVGTVYRIPFAHNVLRRFGKARRIIIDAECEWTVCQIPFAHSILRRLSWIWRFTEDVLLSVPAVLCLLVMLPWALWICLYTRIRD